MRPTFHSGTMAPSHGRPQQTRTFLDFSLFRAKGKDKREADIDPGIEDMMALVRRQDMRARLPPKEDIAAALEAFFAAKKKSKTLVTDTQARLALRESQVLPDDHTLWVMRCGC